MAEGPVTQERYEAGADYLESLRALDFAPNALLWTIAAARPAGPDLSLALVSGLVDRYGPKEIYHLLFEAYERAGTPKAIDPWIVDLYGIDTEFAQQLKDTPEVGPVARLNFADGTHQDVVGPMQAVSDRMFHSSWVYVREYREPDVGRDIRRMAKFRSKVRALAA